MDPIIITASFLWLWFVHVVIAFVLAGPFIFAGRKRAHFRAWEALAFVLPFVLWTICMLLNGKGKSLANLAEPFCYISPAVALAALLRVIVGDSRWSKPFACVLLSSLCVIAVCVYWFTPGWPE